MERDFMGALKLWQTGKKVTQREEITQVEEKVVREGGGGEEPPIWNY